MKINGRKTPRFQKEAVFPAVLAVLAAQTEGRGKIKRRRAPFFPSARIRQGADDGNGSTGVNRFGSSPRLPHGKQQVHRPVRTADGGKITAGAQHFSCRQSKFGDPAEALVPCGGFFGGSVFPSAAYKIGRIRKHRPVRPGVTVRLLPHIGVKNPQTVGKPVQRDVPGGEQGAFLRISKASITAAFPRVSASRETIPLPLPSSAAGTEGSRRR